MKPAASSSAARRLLFPQKGPLQYSTMGAALFPFRRRAISFTSETYWDMGTPGLGATLSAPGTWLTAYSLNGRESNTVALWSVRTFWSSAVETSGVFWLGSTSVA